MSSVFSKKIAISQKKFSVWQKGGFNPLNLPHVFLFLVYGGRYGVLDQFVKVVRRWGEDGQFTVDIDGVIGLIPEKSGDGVLPYFDLKLPPVSDDLIEPYVHTTTCTIC